MQHKAIRAANRLELYPPQKNRPLEKINNNLRPLNIKRCIDVLNVYKKHLEELRFYKHPHNARWMTTKGIEGRATGFHENNPDKIISHTKSSDMERSKEIARKMLKIGHRHYKKAA